MTNRKDFFISYNNRDKQWANWIAGVLEGNGYSTIIQERDFKPGNNFVLEMQAALEKCRKIIAVLSKNYLESFFCQPEWASAFSSDPTGNKGTLIPVRIDNTSPPGLLAPIIYIDLYGCTEDDAVTILLDGVSEKRTLSIPKFPGQNSEPAFKTSDIDKKPYEFIFMINKDNSVEEFSVTTKSALGQWFVNDGKEEFVVAIRDERIDAIRGNMVKIVQKIELGQDLTSTEEEMYAKYMRQIKKCQRETAVREKACAFFLKDEVVEHGFFLVDTPNHLYKCIEKILKFDYKGDKETKSSNPECYELEIFTSQQSKEYLNHFSVPLERSKVKKAIENEGYLFGGIGIMDLGMTLLREVAIYFYFFLAEEALDGFNKIAEDKYATNLLNYQVGFY